MSDDTDKLGIWVEYPYTVSWPEVLEPPGLDLVRLPQQNSYLAKLLLLVL